MEIKGVKMKNKIYSLQNKRFEIIHIRYNVTNRMFNAIMHDEYLNKDVILSGNNLIELHKKTKDYIENQGFSVDLRVNPESIEYKY